MDNMTDTREIPTIALPGNVIMPMVGFGTWPMRGQKACVAVTTALQAGYRHLDTATMYANEEEVGRAVRDSGLPRQDVFLTSKLRAGDAGRERAELTRSLRVLGTD
jgi:2,5-diketo-D-gluconate reductase A